MASLIRVSDSLFLLNNDVNVRETADMINMMIADAMAIPLSPVDMFK